MASFSTLTIEEATERLIDYRGKTPPKTDSGIRLVTAKVVKSGQIHDDPAEFIAADFYDEWMRRGLPKKLDVLLTTEAPLGEVAILRHDARIALAQRIILLRANPELLDPLFLFYALQSSFGQGELRARASGTTVLGIKQSELRKVRIPVCPLPIQRRIAGILSTYDELIENNERRIKILEAMVRAIYCEWFVHFRFPSFGSATFIESEKGNIPEGWALKALGSVGTMALGGTPSRKVNAYWTNGDIPWLKSGALNATRVISASEYITKDALASSATKLLPRKAVVVAITGAILVSYLEIEACANQSVIGIYNLEGVGSEYLHLLLEQNIKALENLMTGSAQQHINKEVLGAVKILVPPASLMQSFLGQATPIYEQISALLFATENLRRTRDLLLPRLFSGELDVEASAA